MQPKTIDLNCDLGESYGAYTIGLDHAVLPFITSANVACGYHAGDPLVMEATVRACKAAGVHIGAHPGFPDLIGFGRRNLAASPQEVKAYVQYQVGALQSFCKAARVPLCHVKPHGALYNMAAKDIALASAICEAIAEIDGSIILLALSGSKMIEAAQATGLPCAREVFADRAYEEDGSLVARSKPGAMITDEAEAIARVVGMAQNGRVRAVTGKEIPLQPESVCVHGDNSHALAFVQKIRRALEANAIALQAMHV
ncbi:MAG: 5-oxoprolinase subunit PxpA [Oscillospiraceae bacterium]|nr:5-oxoprolinase subunit PxpA [Oscillospiraceae bacterium]